MLTTFHTTWQSLGGIRYLICVPLWLALWNAPLPWVHRHDMAEAQADRVLAWHLRAFHHAPDSPHDSRAWHWHFAFLWQMMDCHPISHGKQNSNPVLMTESNQPCLSAPDITPRDLMARNFAKIANWSVFDLQAEGQGSWEVGGPSGQFPQTFFADAPRGALLGVARC